ncbi:histidine phosphatase family protein [Arthrobacter roseus]|uniref:histidine phosphatase family protein n=1 Tax=Arthrobacter roseus TaxID=136274 RepID=UPI0019667116|nr:histidine phosphatase family protein [Arthrobacter roseus]MBM7849408.1 putative phosphoglycerate mutase [Arthrobacter roseus]
MRLILIRHGQTPNNVLQLLDTAVPGPGLTDIGLEQAAAIPEALVDERIDALFASNQTRAQLTAGPLAAARGLKLQIRDGLREIGGGDLEMAGDSDSHRRYLEPVFGWATGKLDRRVPGGPDGHETLGRFDAVVQEALDGGHDAVAMVSHGAMIRAWAAARALNIQADFAAQSWLGNTGVIILEHVMDQWVVASWMGEIMSDPRLETEDTDGPAGDPIPRS